MSKNDFVLVIPARYKSKRFLGKPLKKINGVPMIIRTCRQCLKAVSLERILVATDDERIIKVCKKFGFKSFTTSNQCPTGSDRVAEVARKTNYPFYINVQGDEPLFNPKDISNLIKKKNIYKKEVLLGYTEIKSWDDFNNHNIPKVLFDEKKNLIYASRSQIPFAWNKKRKFKGYRQVLAYCFPRNKILKFGKIKKKTPLEKIEDIEILRFLELGINVKMIKMSNKSIPVDVHSDLKKVEKIFKKK